jgi:aspartyl/asparaginyl-tRNA synthetase
LITSKYQSILHAFERRWKTVRAMDILFLNWRNRWGSQREERFDVLVEKMKALGIDEEELWWYLDTRRFGQQFTLVLDLDLKDWSCL